MPSPDRFGIDDRLDPLVQGGRQLPSGTSTAELRCFMLRCFFVPSKSYTENDFHIGGGGQMFTT
jgi:hypothetical protein